MPPMVVVAFLLAIAEVSLLISLSWWQVGMQALMMRSEWFAVGRGGEEGPKEEHFLWPLGRKRSFFSWPRIVRRCEQRDLEAEQKQQQKQRRQELEAESHAKLMELMLEIRAFV